MLAKSAYRLEYARDLLMVLVLKELRVRYKRTVLGYAWSVMQPLAFAVVYYIVFKQFIRMDTGDVDYPLFLVCGLFSWQWFGNGLSAATMALIGNAQLITKVNFPRIYAVFSGFVNDLVHFLLAVPVILLFIFGTGRGGHVSWLWLLPLLLLVQGAMMLGLALLVATGNLFMRDLERLIGIGLLMLFHLTPVVYPETLIPDRFRWILYANPMGCLTVNWREALLHGRVDLPMLGISAVMGLVCLVLGLWFFRRLEPRFAEVV